MELWKQLYRASANSDQMSMLDAKAYANTDEISILESDVTGVKGTNEAPDGVFYSEFSEDEARSYKKIFTNFEKMYRINSNLAISGLKEDLERQNRAVIDNFCPIELILYSSRHIGRIITADSAVFKLLRKIIGSLMYCGGAKSVPYIMGGWEWKTQIAIFAEAIGKAAPELIDIAMTYYPHVAELCVDDDKSVLKSYVNMLIYTQNKRFSHYFAQVVTNEMFMNDTELIVYFSNSLYRDPYWKNEQIAKIVLDEIEKKALSHTFRNLIVDLKRKIYGDRIAIDTGHSLSDKLNSENIDYETKEKLVSTLFVTGNYSRDIFEWERVKNPQATALVNKRAMEFIDCITPEEIRGRAYITLATHGKRQKNDIVQFLFDHKGKYPKYRQSIDIAFYELNVIDSDDLFRSIFSDDYLEFHGKNLGKYFRYKKIVMSGEFMMFLKRNLKPGLEENTLGHYLTVLYHVLSQFNGNNGKIADESLGIVESLMPILLSFNGRFGDSNTYNSFMDILDLIAKESPSSRSDVLKILDKFKTYVSRMDNMLSVEYRINANIRKLDGIAAPQ